MKVWNGVKTGLLVLVAIVLLSGCQMMARVGAAGVGAATGAAIAGPPGAFTGAGVALSLVEVAQAEGEVEEVKEDLEEAKDVIKAMSEGDVTAMLGESKTGIIATVWGWIKVIFGIIVAGIILSLLYTLKRKKFAKQYYEKIDKLWEKLDE